MTQKAKEFMKSVYISKLRDINPESIIDMNWKDIPEIKRDDVTSAEYFTLYGLELNHFPTGL